VFLLVSYAVSVAYTVDVPNVVLVDLDVDFAVAILVSVVLVVP
jgi:flagellar assembly factor FliW